MNISNNTGDSKEYLTGPAVVAPILYRVCVEYHNGTTGPVKQEYKHALGNKNNHEYSLAASGVGVLDECVDAFQEIKLGHKWRYIIYRLTDDLKKIKVEEKGHIGKSFDDFVARLLDAERKGQCRYGIFDVSFTQNTMLREKLCLFLWNPDNAPVKQKMLYTSSLRALKNKLGSGIHVEIQCNDHDDLAMSRVLEKCQDKYQ